MDYGAIARKSVGAMRPMEVQHFLVLCSLASDLYCPGYDPRQALAKDTNLARTATRYKIDTAKLTMKVRTELSHRKEKEGKQPLKSVASAKGK